MLLLQRPLTALAAVQGGGEHRARADLDAAAAFGRTLAAPGGEGGELAIHGDPSAVGPAGTGVDLVVGERGEVWGFVVPPPCFRRKQGGGWRDEKQDSPVVEERCLMFPGQFICAAENKKINALPESVRLPQ